MSGRRLLWVDVKVPAPDRDSASLRAVQILEVLPRLGFAVDFAALAAGASPGDPGVIARHGARLVADADEAAVLQHIAAHGHDYAVVMLSWTPVVRPLLDPVRQAARPAFHAFATP